MGGNQHRVFIHQISFGAWTTSVQDSWNLGAISRTSPAFPAVLHITIVIKDTSSLVSVAQHRAACGIWPLFFSSEETLPVFGSSLESSVRAQIIFVVLFELLRTVENQANWDETSSMLVEKAQQKSWVWTQNFLTGATVPTTVPLCRSCTVNFYKNFETCFLWWKPFAGLCIMSPACSHEHMCIFTCTTKNQQSRVPLLKILLHNYKWS